MMKNNNIFVRCKLCGAIKIYKRHNERRCPFRYTHKWIPIKWDDDIQDKGDADMK
jgi:hypothetical protein